MSRIGRNPITIPAGVDVAINDNIATVKGPKGKLETAFDKEMLVTIQGSEIIVARPS
ncbi:MAG: 50S ribosomal protein L6, partial [Oscillospiraceae bacterium]